MRTSAGTQQAIDQRLALGSLGGPEDDVVRHVKRMPQPTDDTIPSKLMADWPSA